MGHSPFPQNREMCDTVQYRMLCLLMREMESNEKQYLFADRYLIDAETVYFDPLKNRVKMIFLPNEETVSGKEQLRRLAVFCKSMISEEGHGYLESWTAELEAADLSYRSAIHRCELLQQEIYVCDIP